MPTEYRWYAEVSNSNEITQGDILFGCFIPLPPESLYEAILADKEESPDPVEIKKADIVILSQACDILNEKIDSIVVCPVWTLKHLVSADPYYRSSKAR